MRVMAWNVIGISIEALIGRNSVFEQADILLFMEI
jgi:hypothetical protein